MKGAWAIAAIARYSVPDLSWIRAYCFSYMLAFWWPHAYEAMQCRPTYAEHIVAVVLARIKVIRPPFIMCTSPIQSGASIFHQPGCGWLAGGV